MIKPSNMGSILLKRIGSIPAAAPIRYKNSITARRDGLIIIRDQVVREKLRVGESLHPEDVLARVVLDDVLLFERAVHAAKAEQERANEAQRKPE